VTAKPYTITMSREFLRDLGRLPPAVYRRAVRAAERMIEDPWSRELHPEKVRRAEEGIRSCQVDRSYRIIWKHIKPNDVILCLVDRHQEAYRRARRKSFTLQDGVVHMADILEVGARPAEAAGEIFHWQRAGDARPGLLFIGYQDQELLGMGVPEEVLPHLRALDDVNQMDLIERLLPVEVYNRLLEIALEIVERRVVPDRQLQQSLRRHQGGDDLYRFVDSEEFKRALAGDMEEWMLFLAPHQRQLCTRTYAGPARIKGVAGSGKTVVAIHRARHLARQALERNRKVLFLTYGNRLPGVVHHLLEHLAGEGAPELNAVECATVHQWCYRFLTRHGQRPNVDNTGEAYDEALNQAIAQVRPRFPKLRIWSRPRSFFADEIKYAIKGRAIPTLEAYLALHRSGRGTPLRATEREAAYAVYEAYQEYLHARGLWDFDDYAVVALRLVESGHVPGAYAAAVVDEIQDLTEAVMRLIRRVIPPGSDDLFLVGDGLQRIYPGGYALGRLGIDIAGRSTLLRRNYRNTQQILRAAHAMMDSRRFDDMDDSESAVPAPEFSVRPGDVPVLHRAGSPEEELRWIRDKIAELKAEKGYRERDFALLYRWRRPYQDLIQQHLSPHVQLVEIRRDAATFFGPGAKHTTFHSAKGLEFKVAFVVGATDRRFVPRDDRSLSDEELADYMARERRLLYVAMTRARDLLYLTCSRGQPSRFLADVPDECLRRE
jgi:superfamily I DNA/RNA helicase/mRNA-degrading endonuclease RelE of RelBE toxin-antitoxin system